MRAFGAMEVQVHRWWKRTAVGYLYLAFIVKTVRKFAKKTYIYIHTYI